MRHFLVGARGGCIMVLTLVLLFVSVNVTFATTYDLVPCERAGPFTLHLSTQTSVIRTWGGPDRKISREESPRFAGDWVYSKFGAIIRWEGTANWNYSRPETDTETVSAVISLNKNWRTDKGIAVGDSLAAVVKAYGNQAVFQTHEPKTLSEYLTGGGQIELRYNNLCTHRKNLYGGDTSRTGGVIFFLAGPRGSESVTAIWTY